MSRHWTEEADPKRHRDFMKDWSFDGHPVDAPRDNLLRSQVFFVEVHGFTFQFVTLAQLSEALAWWEKPIHPSSREWNNGLEHDWEPWFSRLPARILKGSRREEVCKALRRAHEEFSAS